MSARFARVRSRLTSPISQRLPLIPRLWPVLFDDGVSDWAEAVKASSGYEDPTILTRVEAATREVLRGDASFERDSVVFNSHELNWPLIAGLQRAAIRNRGSLSVLDVGGSLGSSFLQCRPFLSDLEMLEWRIVEQPSFVAVGREIYGELNPHFFPSIADSLHNFKPDVVYFGSSLQYFEKPAEWLQKAEGSGAGLLILDRIPVSDVTVPRASIQLVPRQIYPASYPAWIFGEVPIFRMVSPEWTAVADFDALGGTSWTRSGKKVRWRGWIFDRTGASQHPS